MKRDFSGILSLLIVALEPAYRENARIYLEREAKTYPKLTDLARKGRVRSRKKRRK